MHLPEWGAPELFSRAHQQRFRPAAVGDAVRERLLELTGDAHPFAAQYGDVEILAFRISHPVDHYLFSTFGLAPVRSSLPLAGTHTELTLRVPAAGAPLPPGWPAAVLGRLVRHIRRTGRPIEPGHYFDFHAPVADGARLSAFSFVADPLLGVIDSRLAMVRFTYAVGLTARDLEDALAWDPLKFTGVLGDTFPLGLSDPARADVATHRAARRIVAAATAREGSTVGAVESRLLGVEGTGRIDVSVDGARAILRAMRHRLPFGRPFALVAGRNWLLFDPDLPGAIAAEEDGLRVPTSPDVRNEILAKLDATPGTYRLVTAPLELHVVDTQR